MRFKTLIVPQVLLLGISIGYAQEAEESEPPQSADPMIIYHFQEARVATAQARLEQLRDGINLFYVVNRRLPESLDELTTEVNGMPPVLERVEPDPWDHPYHYAVDAEAGSFQLFCFGPDGASGTDDDIHPESRAPTE